MTDPIIYTQASLYITAQSTLSGRIAAIDAIIDALFITALDAAANDNITEYQLNNGQTIIKANYRGAKAITESIKSFEAMKQLYMNQLNGRMTRLIDGKNFR
jgi:hypothetical protein